MASLAEWLGAIKNNAMIRTIAAVAVFTLFLFTLPACVPQQQAIWFKPNSNDAMFKADRYDCLQKSLGQAPPSPDRLAALICLVIIARLLQTSTPRPAINSMKRA
jgi:hypothetical protein